MITDQMMVAILAPGTEREEVNPLHCYSEAL